MKTTVLSGVIRIYVPASVLESAVVEKYHESLTNAAYGMTVYGATGYYNPDGTTVGEDILILEMWVNQQNEPAVEALVLSLVEKLLTEGEQEVLVTRNEGATLYRL